MTENYEFAEENIRTYEKLRFSLGIYAIDIGTFLFIRPACKLLMIKPVNHNQMWAILHRYDAERRYSRAGLLLMESFHQAYLSDSPVPDNCVNCDFSADHDENSCECRHPELLMNSECSPIKNFDPVPEFCPIKLMEKHQKETDNQ